MLRVMQILGYVWAFPTTLLGLLLVPVAVLSGGGWRCVKGAVEVYGGGVTWLLRRAAPLEGGALALTLGHVILGVTPAALDLTRTHERIHTRQCERWGPLFLPAYLIGALVAHLRGKHWYRDNFLEREAYAGDAR
jgi:hypothetical protein